MDGETTEELTADQIKGLREKVKDFDLQAKQLDDLRKKLETQRRRGQETGPTQAEFNRLHISVAAMMQAIASIEGVPDSVKTQMYTAKAAADSEANTARVQSAWLHELEGALDDNELEWEDPKLAKANELWKGGNFMGAVKEVYRVSKSTSNTPAKEESDDIAKMVSDEVNKALKASGVRTVDTKEGSVPLTPGKRGVTRQELGALNPAKMSSKDLAKQHKAMLDKYYGG